MQVKRKAPVEPLMDDVIEEIESSKSPKCSVFSRLGEKKSRVKNAPCVSSSSKRVLENKACVEAGLMVPPLSRQP